MSTTHGQLAKLLKENKEVNRASESYVSFVVRSKPDKWSYTLEALNLAGLLRALENAGVIKIL
jgi:hypothetical protein